MKTYEVLLTAYRTMVVEAKDEEEAMEIAGDVTSFFDWEHEETRVERELTTPHEIERSKKHCNEFVEYED